MMQRSRAVTLLELMLVLVFVVVGHVGIARLLSHSLRLSERAQSRTELTMAAASMLAQLQVDATQDASMRPALSRIEGRIRLTASTEEAADGLAAITVAAQPLHAVEPLEVTLTAWVPPRSTEHAP